jgi:hypothetical protein
MLDYLTSPQNLNSKLKGGFSRRKFKKKHIMFVYFGQAD